MLTAVRIKHYALSLKSQGEKFDKACLALSHLDDGRARSVLAEAFIYSEEKTPDQKKALLDAVVTCGAGILEYLYRDMTDSSGRIRSHVVTAIGLIASENSCPYLLNLLAMQHDDPSLTYAAARICREKSVEALIAVIKSGNGLNRLFALNALIENNLSVNDNLILELLRDTDPVVRKRAAEIITSREIPLDDESMIYHISATENWDELVKRGEKALSALTVLAKDSEMENRMHALTSLARIDSPETPSLISKMISDPDAKVRIAAIRLFLQSRHIADYSPAVNAIIDDDQNVRSAAEEALIAAGEKVIPSLIEMLQSALISGMNLIYLTGVQDILVKIGAPAVPYLEKIALSANLRLAEAALTILADSDDISIRPLMERMLMNDSERMRSIAIDKLGSYHDAVLFDKICALINDSSADVRKNVYDALSLCDLTRAEKEYKKILTGNKLPDDDRTYVTTILKEIGKVN